jgi:hypothetical protein
MKSAGGEANAPESGSGPSLVADPQAGGQTSAEGTPYVWKNVPILGGGFVTGVIFSKIEKDLIYARTDIGGAYRWDGPNRSWIPITDGVSRDDANHMGIETIAIHPTDPNKVYMAVGTYTQDWAGPGAMYRSEDRGQTWKVTPMSFKMGGNENGRSNGERIAVDPNKPDILYFGSRKNGLWKSEDGAATWKKVESFPDPGETGGVGINIVAFAPKGGKAGNPTPTIYATIAAKEKNVLVSQDAGKSWKPVPEQPSGLMPSHLEFDAAGTMYVSYGNLPGPSDVTDGAVYKFTPSTGKWANITPLEPKGDDKFGYGGLSADSSKAGHLIACSIDRWTMKDEVWRTTDAGKTWKKVGQNGNWHSEGALYLQHGKDKAGITHWTGDVDIDPFNPARATIVGGTGVFMTENLNSDTPVDWKFTNKGLEETAVLSLASPPEGAPLISGVGDICGFRHDDVDKVATKGAHSDPNCNGTTGLDFAEKQPGTVVRVGRVWGEGDAHGAYSTDGGTTWTGFPKEPEGSKAGGAIAVSSDGSTLIWALKGYTPAISKDRGQSWTKAGGVREGTKLADWTNMDLQPAADRVNPNTFYIYDAMQGGMYVSHDGGQNFTSTYTGLPQRADWQLGATSITAVPGFEGHIWITTGEALYRSTDSGKTFEHKSSVEESYGIGVGKAADGRSYPALYLAGKVGGKKGFYRSDDIGQTWVRLNDDAHQFGHVNIIEGDPRTFGRVYLGTSGRGVIYGMPKQ